MDFKKIRTSLLRFLARSGLNTCSLIIKIMPASWLYGFAKSIGSLGYHLAAKQRKIALESLRIAFGNEKTQAQLEQIARDCFILIAKSGVELIFLMDRPELLKRRVNIVGKNYLDASLSRGQGVILVSAHFGNFPLLMAKLSLQGYKIGAIMRYMRDAQVEKIFLAKRQRLGIKTIYSQPRDVCVETTIRSLRNNEIIFIPLDQNFGTGGVYVDFFGKKAATATGPAILAQRTQAAVIPCFIIRQKDDTHKLIFEQPIDLITAGSQKETVAANIQKLTGIIESYIRRYPAEWGWIHKRWKSRPRT